MTSEPLSEWHWNVVFAVMAVVEILAGVGVIVDMNDGVVNGCLNPQFRFKVTYLLLIFKKGEKAMFKNFKLMIGQLLFISIVALLLDKTVGMSQWINYVIPASCFIILFLGMQIKDSVKKIDNTISSDGIAGARTIGIFVNAILLPWSLGWFENMYVDVFMLLGSLFCIVKGRKYFKHFFCENNWKKEYWFVYWGGTLMLSGIYSVLSYCGIAPCGIVNIYARVLIVLLFLIIMKISLPPNTWLAKFATKNYEKLQ